MRILKAKVFDFKRQQHDDERRKVRNEQIGTASRSEKHRTYNFPQNRMTDHRGDVTIHDIPGVLSAERLDEVIDALQLQAREEALKALETLPQS